MALSTEQKRSLQLTPKANEAALRARMDRFMSARGMTDRDIAALTGYSGAAVSLFRNGHYGRVSANAQAFCQALARALDEHDVDLLDDGPVGKLYTHTRNYKFLAKMFFTALDTGCGYYAHGNPGVQKTYVVKALIQKVLAEDANKNGRARRVLYVEAEQGQSPLELVKEIARSAGVFPSGTKSQLLLKIRYSLARRRSLLVIDELQRLSLSHQRNNAIFCLEAIRPLLDHQPKIGMLFLGSHNLAQIFSSLELEQWNSRVRAGKSLPGLDEAEAEIIVRAELPDASAAGIRELIEGARTEDMRAALESIGFDRRRRLPGRGSLPTYISARKLFWSIQEIHSRMAQKGASA